MDTALENTLALEKAIRTNDRAVRQGGWGDSDHALWITKGCLQALTDLIDEDVKLRPRNHSWNDAKEVIGKLPSHIVAFHGYKTAEHS